MRIEKTMRLGRELLTELVGVEGVEDNDGLAEDLDLHGIGTCVTNCELRNLEN